MAPLTHSLTHKMTHYQDDPVIPEHERLERLAQHYLGDPLRLQQLCDHVYNTLRSDLQIQKERFGNSHIGRQ